MRINHNIQALNAYRNLAVNQSNTAKNLEKLSSGLRINRAADDAAGLAISEKMRSQIRGLEVAERNALDAISLIQTAEGALSSVHSMLQRMRELAVQASNDTNTADDRAALDQEIQQLKTEITRVATSTDFNKTALLDGTFGTKVDQDSSKTTALLVTGVANITTGGGLKAGTYTISWNSTDKVYELKTTDSSGKVIGKATDLAKDGAGSITFKGWDSTNSKYTGVSLITVTTNGAYKLNSLKDNVKITGTESNFQIGANEGQVVGLSISDMTTTGLGIDSVTVTDHASAQSAISVIDEAIRKVSEERGKLGAYQNRLEHTINNLKTAHENLTSSESRIRDTDMAMEMTNFTKNNILNQAAQAMLAQSNQLPQGILQLLKS
ncbi:flagellin N-terminal helical domain-containing protein [Anoxybacillus flavithermus]|uniref:flagellin N-terminal helical domain-containing protein n=1 Tax=Anoxybacillus flavithermus TaxID=33934 RepID=UPI0007D937F3|nr:flagellin [Anoxybacillus flavithermus]MBE2920834.1 flagellin [Anoxybacillus flavithermus]MBE2923406.1 flagellin [Anoxybacillus flavithermus]MBE2926282.1 flagellin [Anoxybacillus flavithermus]MBE2932285.1 flagellin [Anoxybacillus flavithermus]MBE2937265.1 flagellin [Anoxybacillus flavithermus]